MNAAFIDINWADQVMELVTHTGSLIENGDDFVSAWQEKLKSGDTAVLPAVLADLIKHSTVFYAGNAEDVESTMNSISRLVCQLGEERDGLVQALCDSLTSEQFPGKEAARMRIVGNIFNDLEADSPSRYIVYMALITLVGRNGTLHTVEASFSKVDTWVKQWQISTSQIRALYKHLHEVSVEMPGKFAKLSCRFLSKLLETYDTESAEQIAADEATIKPLAMKLVGMSLSDRDQFNLSDVLQLKVVQSNKGEQWYELLSLFEKGDISEYRTWAAKNGAVLEAMNLSADDMMQKIRLQGFCYLCGKSTTIPFSVIAKALEVDEDEVELWTIEAIKAGLVEARIDQAHSRVLVSRSRTNKFVESDWSELRDRLASWQKNLGQCQLVMNQVKIQMEEAKKRGQPGKGR